MAINKGIQYCMASVFLAYKNRNPFPIIFSLFLRNLPSIPSLPQVEPDQTTSCACSLQRPAADSHVRYSLTGR
jgi:hypothetical protein